MNPADMLLLSLVCISLALSGTFLVAWSLFDRARHALLWCLAYFGIAVQYSLNIIRADLPSAEFYWITASLVSAVVVTLALWGHRSRLLLPTPAPVLVVPILIVAVLIVVTTFGFPETSLRVAVSPTYTGLTMSYVAWLLWHCDNKPLVMQKIAALVHLSFGLTQLGAAWVAATMSSPPLPQELANYRLLNFSLMPASFVAMGVSVFLLMACDLSQRLSKMALTDALTGVTNLRGFVEAAQRAMALSRRSGQPLSLVLVDLDHFKQINDHYGHVMGDRALRHIVAVFSVQVRLEDVVGRVGGEEFALLLTDRNAGEARQIAERLRRAMVDNPLNVGRRDIQVTASFGVAQLAEGESFEDWRDRADKALYQAKAAGRDQTAVASNLQIAATG